MHFEAGRGFAVDCRVRNSSQAYAAGVITTFHKTESGATKYAAEVNSGQKFPPGHRWHGLAHGAIVVPAFNFDPHSPEDWRNEECVDAFVAAYAAAGVPEPSWLRTASDHGKSAIPDSEPDPRLDAAVSENWPSDPAARPRPVASQGEGTDAGGGIDEQPEAVDVDALLAALDEIRLFIDDGRTAPYQLLTLLWSISRARRRLPRLIHYGEVRDELADLLSPFRLGRTAPTPANPWFALDESGWWELAPPKPASYNEVPSMNTRAGLLPVVYDLIASNPDFALRAVNRITARIEDSDDLQDLLVANDLIRLGPEAPRDALPRIIPARRHETIFFTAELRALGSCARERREGLLQSEYQAYLEESDHEVCTYEIPIDGVWLETDLYVVDTDELIEVKSSVDRVTMRLALGQILDYARIVKPSIKTVLVPDEPVASLRDLFFDHGVRLIWRDGKGGFTVRDPLGT